MNFETASRQWWVQATRSVRAFPADLFAVVGFLVLVNVVFLVPGLRDATVAGASVRTLAGIPALLFLPGYVLVSMFFPAETRHHRPDGESEPVSIDRAERLALAFGMSLAFLPLFGVALGTWFTVSTPTVLTSLSALLLGGVVVAAIRRLRLPPAVRAGTSLGDLASTVRRSDSVAVDASSLVLGLAVLLAVGAVGFAVATPYQSGQSSTFYLLSENETGAQVASSYPTNFTVGETRTLSVGVENDEERRQPYTIVVALERVETGTSSVRVTEIQEIGRVHTVVETGEAWTGRTDVTPQLVGDDLRLHYYLYRGETAPATPDSSSAYRDVYVWIDVVEP